MAIEPSGAINPSISFRGSKKGRPSRNYLSSEYGNNITKAAKRIRTENQEAVIQQVQALIGTIIDQRTPVTRPSDKVMENVNRNAEKVAAENDIKEAAAKKARFFKNLKFFGFAALFALGFFGVKEVNYQNDKKEYLDKFEYVNNDGTKGNSAVDAMEERYHHEYQHIKNHTRNHNLRNRKLNKATIKHIKEDNANTQQMLKLLQKYVDDKSKTVRVPTNNDGTINWAEGHKIIENTSKK